MNPLVSIIIPTYNRASLISETLDSIIAQTYTDWECIIVDDGSTDNTSVIMQHYIKKDSHFHYYHRPTYKLKGPSSCRNFGIEKAKGDYVIFLDSDDLLAHNCLENRIEFALQNFDFDFWIFKMSAFDDKNGSLKFVCGETNTVDENLWSKKKLMKGEHPFMITGPLWKKEVLLYLKGFNEELVLLEDLELHLRALKENFRLKFANCSRSDCFCRKDLTRKESYGAVTLKNHFLFFDIHLEEDEKEILSYFKKVFNSLIFKKISYIYYYKFCSLGIKRKILTIKNIFYGIVILFYETIGFSKVKGLGYNYFKAQFNNF